MKREFRTANLLLLGAVTLVSAVSGAVSGGALDLGEVDLAETTGFDGPMPVQCRSGKVASLSLSVDEMLYEFLPRQRWAGVSFVVDWPSVTPLAGHVDPSILRVGQNVEAIVGLNPAVALVSDWNLASLAERLSAAGICVKRIPSASRLEEVANSGERLGTLLGEPERAAEWAEKVRTRIRRLTRVSPPRSVLLLQGTIAYGRDTLPHDCLRLLGQENALDRHGIRGTASMNQELILGLRPDLVILAGPTEQPRRPTNRELNAEFPLSLLGLLERDAIWMVPENRLGSLTHQLLPVCELLSSRLRQESQAAREQGNGE